MRLEDIDPEDLDKFHVVLVPSTHSREMAEKYGGALLTLGEEEDRETTLCRVLSEISYAPGIGCVWWVVSDEADRAVERHDWIGSYVKESGLTEDLESVIRQCAEAAAQSEVSETVDRMYDALAENCESIELSHEIVSGVDDPNEAAARLALAAWYTPIHTPHRRRQRYIGDLLTWPEGRLGTLMAMFKSAYSEDTQKIENT